MDWPGGYFCGGRPWTYREIPTGCVCAGGLAVWRAGMGCAQANVRDLRGGDAGSAHAGTCGDGWWWVVEVVVEVPLSVVYFGGLGWSGGSVV
jgi:hypothetical protein